NQSGLEFPLCKRYRRSGWETIQIEDDRGGYVRFAKVDGLAFVTLNDSFYPGWIARDRITGTSLEVWPTNINFRSVFLPDARSYEVEFRYRPPWLFLSMVMALIAITAWLGLAAFTFSSFGKYGRRMVSVRPEPA